MHPPPNQNPHNIIYPLIVGPLTHYYDRKWNIQSTSQILEDPLHYIPLFMSNIRYESTKGSHLLIDVWSSTYHNTHQTTICTNIRNIIFILNICGCYTKILIQNISSHRNQNTQWSTIFHAKMLQQKVTYYGLIKDLSFLYIS